MIAKEVWSRLNVKQRFTVIDTLLNFCLFTPLVVLFWFGGTLLLERTLLTWLPPGSGGVLLLLGGVALETCAAFWQRPLTDAISGRQEVQGQAAARLYIFVLAWANVWHYAGTEEVLTSWTQDDVTALIKVYTTATLLLCGLKCLRNVVDVPLFLEVDSNVDDFTECSSYLQTEADQSPENLKDNLLTIGIISTIVNVHWIATWGILDEIFPNTIAISMLLSWFLGYLITFIFICLQRRCKLYSQKFEMESKWRQTIFEDVFVICANIGCVLIWRGWWLFFEILASYFPIYILSTDMTPISTNIIAFGLLVSCHISSSLLCKGCELDGVAKNGEGVLFWNGFFSVFFKDEITKQVAREDEALKEKEIQKQKEEAKAVLNNTAYKRRQSFEQRGKQPSLRGLIESSKAKKSG